MSDMSQSPAVWCAVQVVQSLQALYDKHKGSYGWEDRPLSIE